MKRKLFLTLFLVVICSHSLAAHAATMSLSPSTGTFSVGSTFDVSITLDTNGKSVNALAVSLGFPPDMLQVVSPSLGQSVIGVWTAAPTFNNSKGELDLQGGVPGGITASNALISTVTFRVKSVGSAIVKFLDGSKVLLNDGLGTNALSQTSNALYTFKLSPPAGPAVTSETNPDQAEWYKNKTVSFRFTPETEGVQGYSYTLSDDPTTIPDDINLGKKNSVTYTNLADGVHFFHIKSLRDGVWGGTTHYSVKIDATPPADFLLNVSPSTHTTTSTPIIQFSTTDSFSGIDHYEIKVVPLSVEAPDTLFTEAVSPYVSAPLQKGNYDVILRAYDKSHNYREVTQRIGITSGFFSFTDSGGFRFGDTVITWRWILAVLGVLLCALTAMFFWVRKWHASVHDAHKDKKLPESVSEQLEHLKKYRAKYGSKALVAFFATLILLCAHTGYAQTQVIPLAPPAVTTISKNISNQDIFYIGGKTDTENETVLIYLQNLDTGATLTENTQSDKDGNWFYRETHFLSPGNYRLWVQGKIAGELSPPGPQSQMTIERTAIQFGSNRLSYETIYLIVIVIMIIVLFGLVFVIGYHYYHGRKKHKLLLRQVAEAEESLRRGFSIVRRDIEDELSVFRKALPSTALTAEERERESRLTTDLAEVEKRVGKELWDIEHDEEK